MIEKYIFLPGLSRCGTTFISNWMLKNSQVALIPESYLIPKMHRLVNPQFYPKEDRSQTKITYKNARALTDSVYNDLAGDKTIILDKSPGNLKIAWDSRNIKITDVIKCIYPEALSMVIYKDGKDFVYSYLNLPWAGSILTTEQIIDIWVKSVKTIMDGLGETLIIRYEDILENPDRIKNSICSFLGIELPPLDPWVNPINTKHSVYNKERWKTLDSHVLKTMKIMNPFLEKMGYETI